MASYSNSMFVRIIMLRVLALVMMFAIVFGNDFIYLPHIKSGGGGEGGGRGGRGGGGGGGVGGREER